jgi:lysophospholipase L1-like esterase
MKLRESFGAASLVLAPAAAMTYAAYRAQRAPAVTPERFVAEQMRRRGHTVVALLGASLVHGRIGASFADVLASRLGPHGFQFINAGVNGDLAYNARRRLDAVIACEPDVVIALIGSNDVMASLGARRALGYALYKRLPRRPNLPWFRENLTAIATELTTRTRARVVLCSLPTLGERIDADVNRQLARYNAVVRDVADQYGTGYLALHEHLDAWLEQIGHASGPPFAKAAQRTAEALVKRYVLGRDWDAIAESHGYALFVDGVHASDRGAFIIADEFERYLRTVVAARHRA